MVIYIEVLKKIYLLNSFFKSMLTLAWTFPCFTKNELFSSAVKTPSCQILGWIYNPWDPFIIRSLIDTNEIVERNLKEIFGKNLYKVSKELSEFLKKLGVPQNLNELKINNNKWSQIVD